MMGFYQLIHSGSLFRRTRQHIEVCHVTLKLVKQLLDGRDRRRRLSVLQALLDITARFLFQTRIKSQNDNALFPFFHRHDVFHMLSKQNCVSDSIEILTPFVYEISCDSGAIGW